MVEFGELGAGALSHIVKFLPVQDIVRISQVCKLLHHVAQNDSIWHTKALERYPAETVRLGGCYTSYQELMRDDNAEHAALLLPLPGRSCRYKHNRTHYFFECLVLGLEWNRAEHTFRLYFEARGEEDLRHPAESSLGFVVHRGGPPDRRAMQQRLQYLQDRLQDLARQMADSLGGDRLNTLPQLQHQVARVEAQMQQLQAELAAPLELRFLDLLTVVRPSGQRLAVDKRGHKLGFLVFDSLNKSDVLLAELPDSYASKQAAAARGIDLCFCYANPIPVMPHGALVDYDAAIVATVQPGATLLSVFKQHGRYVVPGELMRELESEAVQARQQRWTDHLPREVLEREPPWLV